MDETLMGILKVVFGFSLIIGIHELGHAIAAIICGVKIHRFSIGMGPGIVIKNVRWFNELVFSPIVIGGYVQIDEKELSQKSFFQKFFILINGMLANVLLAVFLLLINGTPIIPAIVEPFKIWLLGWPMTINFLMTQAVDYQNAVSGPIGIGQLLASGNIQGHAISYLNALAILNAAIAMMNLLPLTFLDGGRILLISIQKVFGNTAMKIFYMIFNPISYIVIIGLLVFATRNDLINALGLK